MRRFRKTSKGLPFLLIKAVISNILNICMILLKEKGAPHIRIYGGGGGVIIPREIKELHEYGIAWIFSPEDGRRLGLQGMINRMLEECDFPTVPDSIREQIEKLPTAMSKRLPS